MSGLEDVYGEGGRWQAVGRAVLLLVGGLVAGVGFVATTASLIAGFGVNEAVALKVSAVLGAGLLFGVFFVLSVQGTTTTRSRTLVAVGVVITAVSFVQFWTNLPSGWMGRPAGVPPLAVSAYVAGFLAVFAAGLPNVSDDELSAVASSDSATRDADAKSLGSVESVLSADADDRNANPGSSAVSDGGEVEEDLRFFDGDE